MAMNEEWALRAANAILDEIEPHMKVKSTADATRAVHIIAAGLLAVDNADHRSELEALLRDLINLAGRARVAINEGS